MKKFNKDFWKFGLLFLNFSILGVLNIFNIIESIFTIKITIQTLQLPDFLKKYLQNSSKKKYCHPNYSVAAFASIDNSQKFM